MLRGVAFGLVAGLIAGYLASTFMEPEAPVVRPEREPSRRTARVTDADGELGALRHRVRELERRLAEATAAATAATNGAAVAEKAPKGPEAHEHRPPSMADFRARMEEMKRNDPARYVQMTNRMAQWRSRRLAQTQDRLDFLASLDTSVLSEEQLKDHERLQELLARREELMQAMGPDNPNVTDEQREKAHREMRASFQEIRQLEQAERNMLLQQTARNLGCKGEVAKELVETIQTIYEATQSGGGPHGPPPPGRR